HRGGHRRRRHRRGVERRQGDGQGAAAVRAPDVRGRTAALRRRSRVRSGNEEAPRAEVRQVLQNDAGQGQDAGGEDRDHPQQSEPAHQRRHADGRPRAHRARRRQRRRLVHSQRLALLRLPMALDPVSQERRADPTALFRNILKSYFADNSWYDTMKLWRIAIANGGSYPEDVLWCLDVIAENPPANLGQLLYEDGWITL